MGFSSQLVDAHEVSRLSLALASLTAFPPPYLGHLDHSSKDQ